MTGEEAMLTRLLAVAVMVLAFAGVVRAENEVAAAAAPAAQAAPVEIGNKICPISGEKVGEMGKVETIEYKGKVYNLCCPMCKKDFLKDPEAAIKKLEESMAAEGGSIEAAAEDGSTGAAEGQEHSIEK